MTAAPQGSALDAPEVPLQAGVSEDPDVRVVFTGRIAPPGAADANLSLLVGVGDVSAARTAALDLVGASPSQAIFMEQVHGGAVAAVTAADAGRGVAAADGAIPGVDALVTTATDLALVVLVADCVPVVLVDPGSAVGVVHAGRGGVMGEVVSAAVGRLAPGGAHRVVALLGPAVRGCCYEVPHDLVDEVAARWPAARATTSWGTPSLDLPAAVASQLQALGVSRVEDVGACTRCDPQRWFSHRATAAGAPAGRQAAIVMRAAPAGGARPAPSDRVISLDSPASP